MLPTTFEQLEHRLIAYVYVSNANPTWAYRTLVPFVERFVVAWRLERSLGGVCVESWVAGADTIDEVTVNERGYYRLPIRITVREVNLGTTTSV